jgi:tetratricopeptide (TPR) repeat protein
MSKFSLIGVFSKFFPKKCQKHSFRDVLDMYHKRFYKDAYSALCDFVEKEPKWLKDGDVYTLWAELEFLANRKPCKAMKLLDKAQEIGCSEMGYYYAIRAQVLWGKRELETALHYFEKSVAVDPSVANIEGLATALSYMHDERAISTWQQVLEKDPNNYFAYAYIEREAAKSGEKDKSILMAKKLEELHPSSAEEVADIARFYHELGEFQAAIDKYLEAKKLGFNEESLLYAAIADCYISLGEGNQARKYMELALKHDPENDYVKEVWGEYKEKFGG